MFFELPDPKTASWIAQYIPRSSGTPSIDALESNTHDIVSWECLVQEGLTSARLLACDPRSVAAWVRMADGSPVTLSHIRLLKDGVNVEDVLRRWGDRLCPAIVQAMGIEDHMTPEIVTAINWTPDRWKAAFGKIPIPPTPIPNQPHHHHQMPIHVEKAPPARGRASIGMQVLKL